MYTCVFVQMIRWVMNIKLEYLCVILLGYNMPSLSFVFLVLFLLVSVQFCVQIKNGHKINCVKTVFLNTHRIPLYIALTSTPQAFSLPHTKMRVFMHV